MLDELIERFKQTASTRSMEKALERMDTTDILRVPSREAFDVEELHKGLQTGHRFNLARPGYPEWFAIYDGSGPENHHWQWAAAEGAVVNLHSHKRGNEETVTCNTGEILLRVGKNTIILRAGQSFTFDGFLLHGMRCRAQGTGTFAVRLLD